MTKAGSLATAANPVAPATGAAAIALSGAITNLNLWLALEARQELSTLIIEKTRQQGLALVVPWVTRIKTAVPQSTNQNVSIRFNRGYGFRLRKIIHSVFNNTESANTAYDNQNYAAGSYVAAANGDKVVSYYSMLNNTPLQQSPIVCANWEDYLLHRAQLDGSVIQDRYMYSYNWFHCDDFTQENNPSDQKSHSPANFDIMGLDLTQGEVKWDFIATTSNTAFNHYTYAITQKLLTVSPMDGISCK
jgi:hypothetical protein